METVLHALETCEQLDGRTYGLIILAEPTSPLREPGDIEVTVRTLVKTGADSAVTMSPIDTKCHPAKIFAITDGLLKFHTPVGETVTRRQQLEPLYSRNGLCYCFRRETLLMKQALITQNTVPVLTERSVVNIDEPVDLLWAQFLIDRDRK